MTSIQPVKINALNIGDTFYSEPYVAYTITEVLKGNYILAVNQDGHQRSFQYGYTGFLENFQKTYKRVLLGDLKKDDLFTLKNSTYRVVCHDKKHKQVVCSNYLYGQCYSGRSLPDSLEVIVNVFIKA